MAKANKLFFKHRSEEEAAIPPGSGAEDMHQITCTMAPGLTTGLFGWIDSIDSTGITGWLLDLGEPHRVWTVDAVLAGERISSAETRMERPDVSAVVGKPVSCGFRIPWLRKPLARRIGELSDSDPLPLQIVPRGEQATIGATLLLGASELRRWLESLPHGSDQFTGRLETVSPYRIAGYVIDRMNTTVPVNVEILLDGQPVAQVLAARARTDLLEFGSTLKCGFDWLIPKEFRDGRRRRVEVRVLDNEHILSGSGVTLSAVNAKEDTSSGHVGRALSICPGPVWTTGWVADAETDEPLAVELYVDDQRIAQALAGQYGPDLEASPDYPFENAHTRFTFPTPRFAADGWPHEFRVHVKAWGSRQLENSRVKWANGDYFGQLDHCKGGRVSGWVAFRAHPASSRLSVPVEVFVNGHLAGQCFLREVRPEVANGASPFAYPFEGDLGFEISGELSVRYAAIELRGSPKQVTPEQKLEGRLDRVDRNSIAGWAVDLNRPEEKVELELLIDGHLVAKFRATEARPDVRKALGLQASNLGFGIRTPDLLLDGESHTVEVRFSSTKVALRSTTSTVKFARNVQILPSRDPHPVLSEFISREPRPVTAIPTEAPIVSIVVLNRNGQDVLEALLSSFVAINSIARYEFIVVDHGSKDASIATLEKWTRLGVPINIVALPYNGSFSGSNNLAIREYARGEYVLLLNNDIVFVQDVLPELIRTLRENPRVGLAGVKLLDVVEDRGKNFYPPIQHLGIRYRHVVNQGVLPHDEKLSPESASDAFRPITPAGVTGAVTLCRRSEYLAIGGLEEAYFYGYEDVDLCLKYRVINKQNIICRNDLTVLHHRGYSRLSGREMGVFDRLTRNHLVLMERWGYAIRHLYRQSLFRGDRVYTGERLRVAFAVTETGPDAVAGDYFTALELANALADFQHVEPVFLSERSNWYDLDRIHVLVVMRHDYDLRCITNARPDLVTVAWLRNHFEGWTAQRWFDRFDLYLSSSARFIGRLSELGYRSELLPIATNLEAMSSGVHDPALSCAVGFNGSAWAVERNIVKVLEKIASSRPVTVVGRGWEDSSVAGSHKGLLAYDRMADFYASTEIVVDDANHSASAWGSANSRVFDALAAGRLVITNSAAASSDLFDGLIPVWSSTEEAVSLISKYLEDTNARSALVRKLQDIVKARHTYKHRAARLVELLQQFATENFRIAIKVPVPNASEKQWWGDWHFAESLSKALKSEGHSVRIDLLCDWNTGATGDDVVIVLRGLSEYKPDPTQINLLWILSHPEAISVAECSKYDHVFSASQKHVTHLQSLGVSASPLLQCADPARMRPVPPDPATRHEHLFVGNSRGQTRKIVSDLIAIGVDLAIYGREWDGIAPEHVVKGDLIRNEALHRYYSNAGVVYNDHWPDMAKWGFISNRLFDAGACGAYIISDELEGLDEVFEGLIQTYGSRSELAELSSASARARWTQERADTLRKIVLSGHTFTHRAQTLLAKACELRDAKLSGRNVLEQDNDSPKAAVRSVRQVASA